MPAPAAAPLVSVCVVVHDGLRWLPGLLASVRAQDHADLELLLLDAGSSDGSAAAITAAAAEDPRIRALPPGPNIGYAAGQDRCINAARGAFLLLLNQDVELAPGFLTAALRAFAAHPEAAAVQGRILRLAGPGVRTATIDTTGLVMGRDRRAWSRAQGAGDGPEHATAGTVWGADGPAPVLRRAALADARLPGRDGPELLDADFFMYKEDVDLAWRLHRLGWVTRYVPDACAWHARTAAGSGQGWRAAAAGSRALPPAIRALSWRNQRLMQVKNDPLGAVVRDLPAIVGREVAELGWLLVRDPRRLGAAGGLVRLLPRALAKRRALARAVRARRGASREAPPGAAGPPGRAPCRR
ncbi:MAG: glycosyltransferase, partial [Chloroflexota bacterium]